MFTSFYAASLSALLPNIGENAEDKTLSISPSAGSAHRPTALKWARRVFPLLLLLICFQIQATDYVFPANPPSNCVANSAGSNLFTCSGTVTLGAGDTISVAVPTQITINGDFNTGASVKINANGVATNLTIYVSGTTTLGANNTFHGNIIGTNNATGTITTGDGDTIVGNLTTTTAGVINIGNKNTVTGDLTTQAGAINVGDNDTVNGNILVQGAGAITIGSNTTINGNVASTTKGSDSSAGAITVNENSTVKGSINTFTGAITVQTGSVVGGNIGTSAGAITVATKVDVTGSVCVGSAGAITIGASSNIGGNVEAANAGAITVGTKATVTGDVTGNDAITIAADASVGTTRLGKDCALGTAVPPKPPIIITRHWRQLFMR